MKPLIGITTRFAHDEAGVPPLVGVRTPYLESILKAGGIPVAIPLIADQATARSLYTMVNGVLIPGGEDVDPSRYGEKPHPKLGTVCDARDELEINITRWAYQDDKPILGVCRGIQVMNVALGGSLYQDIESEDARWSTHNNKPPLWEQTPHELIISPNSKLLSIIKSERIPINSLHHQAPNKIAKSLQVSGTSDDGVVEALEAPDRSFFLAVQCHPELLWQKKDARWLGVFTALIEAASKYSV